MDNPDEEKPIPTPKPKVKRSAKAKAKKAAVRTIGTNRYGVEDDPKIHPERVTVDLYEGIRKEDEETGEGKFTVEKRQVRISATLLVGIRLDPRQAIEYFHLMDPTVVPDPGFPELDAKDPPRTHPWRYSWQSTENMDKVYGSKMPKAEELMEAFLKTMDKYKMTMIIDEYGYVYLGYTPQPFVTQDGYRGYFQYNYKDMHSINVKQMENLQRLMYRVPLHDSGLTAEQVQQLHEIRMGGAGKYPCYFLVNNTAAIANYPHYEQ